MFPLFLTSWDYNLAMKYQDEVLEKKHGDALTPLMPLLCPPRGKIPPHIRNARAAYMFAAADCDMEVIAELRRLLGDIIIVPRPEWDVKGMYWWRAQSLCRIPMLRLCSGKNNKRQILARAVFDTYHCHKSKRILEASLQALLDARVLVHGWNRTVRILAVNNNMRYPRLAWKAGEQGVVYGQGIPPEEERAEDFCPPQRVAEQTPKELKAALRQRAQAGDQGGSVAPEAGTEQPHSYPHGVARPVTNTVPAHLPQEHVVSLPTGHADAEPVAVAPVVQESSLSVETDRREYEPQPLRNTGEVGSEPSVDQHPLLGEGVVVQ